MSQPQVERRTARRFVMRLPVTVKTQRGALTASTRDVSSRGVALYSEHSFTEGSEIQFTLTLPAEITLTEDIPVQCIGHVLRVDPARDGGKPAVAAVIDRYDFPGTT